MLITGDYWRCAEVISNHLRKSAYNNHLNTFKYINVTPFSRQELLLFKKIWKESSFAYLLPHLQGSKIVFSREALQTLRESDIRLFFMVWRMLLQGSTKKYIFNLWREGHTADSCILSCWCRYGRGVFYTGAALPRDFEDNLPKMLEELPYHKIQLMHYFPQRGMELTKYKRGYKTMALRKRKTYAL